MRHFLLVALSFIFLSCDKVDEATEARLITEAAKAFSQAYVAGDLEKQMSFYTQDVVIIPGNRPMIEGIEKVTRYWTLPATVEVLEHRTTSNKLEIDGQIASDYGIYEGKTLRGTDTTAFRGQYVITWRKETDGQWRMAVDMWSALRD